MQILLGALLTALLFGVFAAGFFSGTKRRTVPKKDLDEVEKRKAERLREGFQQMMTYNEAKALGKRVE